MTFATLPPMSRHQTSGSPGTGPIRFLAGWGLVRVRGRSMEPTLRAGDVLLVRQVPVPSVGRLGIVQLPGRSSPAVKRLVRHEAKGWWVERDNPDAGVDSWSVGVVADMAVRAQVVARVWPLGRGLTLR